jgi:diguanylate cyclase (GGDEF)-like protein
LKEQSSSVDEWQERLRALAAELKATPSGAPLHAHLQQLLDDWQSNRAQLDQQFYIRLSFFLGTLSEKVIHTDVAALVEQLMQVRHPGNRQPVPAPVAARALSNQTPAAPTADSAPPQTTAQEPAERGKATPAVDEDYIDMDKGEVEKRLKTYPEVERRVNSAYRLHLDRKHDEIEKLQELLAQKATEAMAQNKAFGALLETERAALQQASTMSEIDDMKKILIGGTDELIEGQRDLADKLHSSFEYLQIIKSDSERLHDELNKVRLLSLTDENTGLPNRRAFVRRLDDEIERAQQYDVPLSLAIIDLDNFKEINDQYGHPAGDAALSWYAEQALPIFRHYDMVARYGGEEFAVLFPGTTGEGGRQALAKMRRHIIAARFEYDGKKIDVPTFSAGVTSYLPGDTEATLFKRADKALYRAKNSGRDRIEMELSQADDDGEMLEL